ncbi:rhomboid family intramembrane serine protease [Actinoallomurus iriomotensis]|uniref:Rhomboid family intramembrane serine protease n=1 Tax=Actinoallomurus iriomotensis TaxID=478107 RepID=A0A9W6RNC0_9ACTN|nr:rhomboid family intramembrane serine protease [Actinoallomurus iriomotensis]GLY78315.1 rhomboid family intramembrane serine protease [Actinoallomurus iriomotensis]
MSSDTPHAPQAPQVPTCYRHPGRETYVSCTRCERPICPDCMCDAAVGHQCPECVRDGNRTVRQARTVFGGRVATRPAVTLTLIAINVVAYIGELASPSFVDRFEMLGVLKTQFGQVIPGYGVADGEWYRLITAAFLHVPLNQGTFGITHILFNMWALWVLGPQLEQVLGRLRFTVLYLLSALGGNVLLFLVDPGQPALGASGAIFGLFAAFFVVGRRLGVDTRGIAFLIVINLMFTFTFSGISWEGHVGGLITGAVLAVAFAYAPRGRQQAVQVAASAIVAAVLVVLTVVQTAALTA